MNWPHSGPTSKAAVSSDRSSDGTFRKDGLELEHEKRATSAVPDGKRAHRVCTRRRTVSVDDNAVMGIMNTNWGQVAACEAKMV